MRRARVRRARGEAWVLLAGLLLATPVGADERTRRGYDLVITPDAGLTSYVLDYTFRGVRPRRLVVSTPSAWEAYTVDPRGTDPGWAARPTAQGLSAVDPRRATRLRLRVSIDRVLAAGGRGAASGRRGRDVLLWPGNALPRPGRWPEGAWVTARFVCPGGVEASVPWPPVPGSSQPRHHRLYRDALVSDGIWALGRFRIRPLPVQGGVLNVAVLDGELAVDDAGIERWLRLAADAQVHLFGRFPVDRAQVLVHPAGASWQPVGFGRALRAGGAAAVFYVSRQATAQDLPGEWVGVHELTHLGLPWTPMGDHWLQEGYVTWYQEVLRARAGVLTPTEAWQKLHEGFGRGRGGTRAGVTLEQASRDMHRNHAYYHVYWGGAAIALLHDLAIRQALPGRSLDDVLRHWHARHGLRRRVVGARALLAEADAFLGRPLGVPIAERLLRATGFPDLSAAYAALGLRIQGRRVVLDPDPARSALARAVMAPRLR